MDNDTCKDATNLRKMLENFRMEFLVLSEVWQIDLEAHKLIDSK